MRILPLLLLTAACASAPSAEPPSGQPDAPPAPWQQPALAGSAVPSAYGEQWRKAENRATCAPVAPAALGSGDGAVARAATFAGGWGVAYDLPGNRSAFGVAGAGVVAGQPGQATWPNNVRWADGSTAGYGPEGGGAGPNQLAYLQIAGQGCLYNVWSRLGREHLEYLLGQLRFVDLAR